MNQKQFTIVLPINKIEESTKEYLQKAIDSLSPFKDDVILLIVTPVDNEIKSFIPKDVHTKVILNSSDKTDFCSQVNLGVENVETKWFSILEIDDQYAPKWFKNVKEYAEAYPDVDIFLPVVADVDEKRDFLSFTNESVWALGFSDVQGYLDNQSLLEYQNFQISGAVYNTEKFKQYGKLKSNIKLSFGLEMLLRFTHNNVKIMTIPKIGYLHTNMRVDSLFWNYKNNENFKLSPEEAKFWMDISKKEYYFTEDRDIQFISP